MIPQVENILRLSVICMVKTMKTVIVEQVTGLLVYLMKNLDHLRSTSQRKN